MQGRDGLHIIFTSLRNFSKYPDSLQEVTFFFSSAAAMVGNGLLLLDFILRLASVRAGYGFMHLSAYGHQISNSRLNLHSMVSCTGTHSSFS